MKIDLDSIPFLEGKKFSNGLKFPVSYPYANVDRLTYIERKCTGKKVVHIGFADHIPLVPEKIRNNKWLHQRLLNVTSKCIGVDVDEKAIEYFKKNYSFQDIYLHDVINDVPLPEIIAEKWDYMILGEILEHVDNPVNFLNELLNKYGKHVKEIIITVPNAMNLMSIRMAKNHKEFINSDHRFWFTPFTLAKVGIRSGWMPVDFDYSQSNSPGRWIFTQILKRYPAYRETLIMTMKSQNYK